jgi:hypothetical protein
VYLYCICVYYGGGYCIRCTAFRVCICEERHSQYSAIILSLEQKFHFPHPAHSPPLHRPKRPQPPPLTPSPKQHFRKRSSRTPERIVENTHWPGSELPEPRMADEQSRTPLLGRAENCAGRGFSPGVAGQHHSAPTFRLGTPHSRLAARRFRTPNSPLLGTHNSQLSTPISQSGTQVSHLGTQTSQPGTPTIHLGTPFSHLGTQISRLDTPESRPPTRAKHSLGHPYHQMDV